MTDKHLASSYRRIFRIVSKDMPNWKKQIVCCVETTMNDYASIARMVKRTERIRRAIEFMVGGPTDIKMLPNADNKGYTMIIRNAVYYVNIGA